MRVPNEIGRETWLESIRTKLAGPFISLMNYWTHRIGIEPMVKEHGKECLH